MLRFSVDLLLRITLVHIIKEKRLQFFLLNCSESHGTYGVEILANDAIICQIFVLFGKFYFYLSTLFSHVNAA